MLGENDQGESDWGESVMASKTRMQYFPHQAQHAGDNNSSDVILPNMRSQVLTDVQPDTANCASYYKHHANKWKSSTVSQPDNFRCIGKIIYSTTGRVSNNIVTVRYFVFP